MGEDRIARSVPARPSVGPTRADFIELKELIEGWLDRLEHIVRKHDADIEELKRSRR